ncbi:hypothetical protein [Legionella septentrionalis]|nr:hypothetical protein [Legionella septentrionalis]
MQASINVCRCCDIYGPETTESWEDLERYLDHRLRHKAEYSFS